MLDAVTRCLRVFRQLLSGKPPPGPYQYFGLQTPGRELSQRRALSRRLNLRRDGVDLAGAVLLNLPHLRVRIRQLRCRLLLSLEGDE